MSSIYWHDYETFGVNPQRDRPVQFAGRRTDLALNPVGEPLSILCRQSDDYLPHPMAALVTGIAPQRATNGLCEAAFAAAVHEVLSAPETCGAGYNSIRFDDEFTRYLLFRNFFDPYQREYAGGNSRWDLIDVVRLCYALRPTGINWPRRDDGTASFRLEHLTAANGIEHSAAHDALADVDATIALAQLVRAHQPRLFDYAFSHRSKHAVAAQLKLTDPNAIVHVSARYPARRGCLALVLPVCTHPNNPNAVLAVDLAMPPDDLLTLPAGDLADRIFTPRADLPEGISRIGVKSIAINRAPVIAPLGVLRGIDAERIELDVETCLRHRDQILPHLHTVAGRLRETYAAPKTFAEISEADWSLYSGGFASGHDRKLAIEVRKAAPDKLPEMAGAFDDPRYADLLFQYRARNWPDTLSADEIDQWRTHCRRRLLDGEPSEFDRFKQELEHARGSAFADGKQAVLDELEGYARQVVATHQRATDVSANSG